MLYIVIKREDLLKINDKNLREDFSLIPTDSIRPEYIFLNYKVGDYSKLLDIILENDIHCLPVEPYVSVSTFNKFYSNLDINRDNLYTKDLNFSFFEVLISGFVNDRPKHKSEYILLNSILPKFNLSSYEIEFEKFKDLIVQKNIYLTIDNVRLSLRDIFVNAFNNVLEKEISTNVVSRESLSTINEDFFLLIVSEFIIMADRNYKKSDIEDFLKEEFNIKKNK